MQLNTLKVNNPKKKKKTIGRGGKKGTYSGKGNKGQKARSGAKINPLFEGGRSTLIDHLKKVRGFKTIKSKKEIVRITDVEKKFKAGEVVDKASLIKAGLVSKKLAGNGIKILGREEIKIGLTISADIFLSKSSKISIEKAGGKIASKENKEAEIKE